MPDLKLAELNRVFLIGRLTKDPEVRQTSNGTPVTNFSIAINRKYKSASGELKEDTTFVGIVAWQKLAELCQQFLAKGRAVLVEGKMQNRSWETEDGQKRSTLEIRADRIEFLDREPRAAGTSGPSPDSGSPEGQPSGPEVSPDKSDDDLPF
ncbi:MAG: single-stranded DNA-binding protein [Candidatus Edwardsbacteria bacterium]|nr:single-stranded DNA-binding protein [Candidatus Edwardsbacteria bacterium]MBU1576328.1 single-stranded DNA-binding protein [Candidatus Edwardsbacteria bacterium]MBU2462881.1 single-stranded DNA-binding protein [Candidatus Edwardsbacteria bacterium]MBU2593940.1 single-stranded DNA-binding protein [Candidatus Edwardsbacteria bacterium]